MQSSKNVTPQKHTIFPIRLPLSILLALLVVITWSVFQQGTAYAASRDTLSSPPAVSAPYAALYDLTYHTSLMTKAATTETEIASTTKIMTALLVLQSYRLDHKVTITQDVINYVNENNASNAGLLVNDKLTVKQLLYAMLLPSGCDAAYAMAVSLKGSLDKFVAEMNQEAELLGLTQTYYTTVDGLHNPDSKGRYGYSTAADLIQLTTYAMQFPLFRQLVGTQTYSLPATSEHHAYTWTNTNHLLGTYPGAIGVKTGTTPWAGYCLVFAAVRNGETLLGVVLSSTSSQQRYTDSTALLNWGFSLFSKSRNRPAA
ncbi:D-alanyl-D-alanine carboxypeptidase family protein [Ktedonosporobacter rubrisoli]|nr:D-alanyl-D-alanine carboxypeptidase [Ktedonosporobacter rubrisoli]